MERKTAKMLNVCGICILLYQIVFLVAAVFFQDIIFAGKSFFYELTFEEWNWLIERGPVAYETEVVLVFMALKYAVLIVDLLVLYYVYLAPQKPLAVSTAWKIVVPLAGLLAYLPCFYLIKYKAPHFLLYMDLVPSEVLSLVSLCLLWIGRRGVKRKAE